MARFIMHINHAQLNSPRGKMPLHGMKRYHKNHPSDIYLIAFLDLGTIASEQLKYTVSLFLPWKKELQAQDAPPAETWQLSTHELHGLVHHLRSSRRDITEQRLYLEANLGYPSSTEFSKEMLVHQEQLCTQETKFYLFTETSTLLNTVQTLAHQHHFAIDGHMPTSQALSHIDPEVSITLSISDKETTASTLDGSSEFEDLDLESSDHISSAKMSSIAHPKKQNKFWPRFFICQSTAEAVIPTAPGLDGTYSIGALNRP